MRCAVIWAGVCFYSILFITCFVSVSSGDVLSDFNTVLDGWTLQGSGTLSYVSADGNPGGYAQFTDVAGSDGDGWMIAPAAFLGNWSTYNSTGTLSWDHIIISTGDIDTIVNPSAIISGPGGTATYTGGQFSTSWHTLSAPINSSSWVINSGTWASILNNVTSLEIRIEAVHNNGALDVDGIDNIRLVPEPSSVVLMAAAVVALLFVPFRRQIRQ